MVKLEHIGIAVKDMNQSIALYESLLNTLCYKTESVESEKLTTAFFQKGETKIELLANTDKGGVIEKFIEKKGEGLHHLAFESENIVVELAEKETQNFQLIHQVPKDGADNKTIAFLHPKTTGGVLTELCQEKANH